MTGAGPHLPQPRQADIDQGVNRSWVPQWCHSPIGCPVQTYERGIRPVDLAAVCQGRQFQQVRPVRAEIITSSGLPSASKISEFAIADFSMPKA